MSGHCFMEEIVVKRVLKNTVVFFIIMLFIFGSLLLIPKKTLASTDVWDGTINTSFAGSGTEADPYLIETASQLAGMASVINNDSQEYLCLMLKYSLDGLY